MEDKKIPAEAVINGITRGGYFKDGIFSYHAGMAYMETKEYKNLHLYESNKGIK